MPFQSKNTTKISLDLWPTHPCFFLVEDTLSPSTATIASWFQHHTLKPTSRLLLPFSEESFHYQLHWQAVPGWFQHGSLSDRQSTNAARILHWRDASKVFRSKFDGKILCWCPLRQQLLGQLNDDFHESQHEVSRHGRRLLMWKVVQAWNTHRPTLCPL